MIESWETTLGFEDAGIIFFQGLRLTDHAAKVELRKKARFGLILKWKIFDISFSLCREENIRGR
jgi:hypothetical protein